MVRAGGEAPPSAELAVEVEFVAIPVSSVLESVLWLLFFVKLALERRRSSFKKAGAMGHLWKTLVVLLVLSTDSRRLSFQDMEGETHQVRKTNVESRKEAMLY